jgi:phosphate-selective porin OprO/OprP
MKYSSLLLLLFVFGNVKSQVQNFPEEVSFLNDNGLSFTSKDSAQTLTFNGRIQALGAEFADFKVATNTTEFFVRRCRFSIKGTSLNNKIVYRVQLCFSQRDMSADNSKETNNLVLRDAVIFYNLSKAFRLGIGQTKLPGNRQRVNSSGQLQFAERSTTHDAFTLDRDRGIFFQNDFHVGKSLFKNYITVSSGEGRITVSPNAGVCYTARTEWLPLGKFKNGGDYFEADLEREQKPKISIGATYSYNDKAKRVKGQLGEYLYNNESVNIAYAEADLLFKFKGFSLATEVYNKLVSNNFTNSSTSGKRIIPSGQAWLVQTGYLFTKKDEIALRYAGAMNKNADVNTGVFFREYLVGYSHYFKGHALKLQGDIGLTESKPNKQTANARISAIAAF